MRLAEVTQPLTAEQLIKQYGGRPVAFRDLPKTAQKSIIKRAKEHLDPSEKVAVDPDHQVGYVELPMEALKAAMLAHVQQEGAPFKTFDEYHAWYVGHGDTPNHREVWPVELDRTGMNVIDDGSHRFHSYVRKGLATVPAIYQL
jgi:hypothetical protein